MGDTNTNAQSADSLTLAKRLHSEQRLDEARALYDSALIDDPANADALHMLGLLELQCGELARAESLIRSALAARPDFMRACSNLGAVLMARERPADAFAAFSAALDLDADDLDARFNLGTAAHRLGRMDEAVDAFRAVVERDARSVDARLNLGTALRERGDAPAAVAVFEALINDNPKIAEAHYNLGTALKDLNRLDNAVDAFQRAVDIKPDFLDAWFNLANTLQRMERLHEAERAIRQLIELSPDMARAHYVLGATLVDREQLEAGAAAFEKALSLDPDNSEARHAIAHTRLRLGEAHAALQSLDLNLRRSPATSRGLADKATALHMVGREDEARTLVDLQRFLHPFEVPVPEGFADVNAFSKALADHTASHPSLTDSPRGHATRHGQHSRELLQGDSVVVRALAATIDAGVRDYIDKHPGDPGHPFLATIPEHWRLTAWAVVMREQGHQIPHIHATAWLSGVYYPLIPASITDNDPAHAGWIEFGRPDPVFPLAMLPDLRLIRPRQGLMVLFPSYVFHRTLPLRGNDLRISVAFDVMPTN